MASEFGATLHTITASSVFGAYTGESERNLREAFEKALEPAEGAEQNSHDSLPPPAVLFLDELDALCPRRDARRPHESRVVAQLLTLLDGSSATGSALTQSMASSPGPHWLWCNLHCPPVRVNGAGSVFLCRPVSRSTLLTSCLRLPATTLLW